ncbi:GTPase [Aureisphaera galaxeae]|uniref:GTPase n=1 Tax=Aureisphaera galaxeae TaxID=1538023 RepID=UPI00234FE2D4|nr:GTPase [Aureisphaera galaxeae]MDC8003194.1 GTPase [Aureisphaera galaxeae]
MKLIFVYNADSGFVDKLLDNVHKIVSPSTYDCNLCTITFGKFTEDDLWKSYRQSSDHEMKFLHKDEFLNTYRSKWLPKYDFPVVLSENKELEVFIDATTLNEMNSSEELIEEISKRTR